MKLYHAPGSCSQAVHIVLLEANMDAELVEVDARRHVIKGGGDYYEITPLGYVPLLYAVAAGKYVDTARPKLLARFKWIDRQLEGKRYLMGETFTLADAYLFALTGWAKATWIKSVYHADIDLSGFENLQRWYEGVRVRPCVQTVLAREGLAD
ncbi:MULTISPECIES: glutathione binding-like protein [unclassified Paraburkholderia]|uniref:glutathione binding-like protein n=1 Tax=unclassified Paraburkholderia TaxID=2615204 RepID=UPI002AAF2B98|nr:MULTISPECIES: glutathione binding-like protein [unclassified Paraburkholderia]